LFLKEINNYNNKEIFCSVIGINKAYYVERCFLFNEFLTLNVHPNRLN